MTEWWSWLRLFSPDSCAWLDVRFELQLSSPFYSAPATTTAIARQEKQSKKFETSV